MGTTAASDAGVSITLRIIHFALAVLCLAGWITGDPAGDYKNAVHSGYDLHAWLGIAFTLVILARFAYGFAGPRAERFSAWVPVTPARLQVVKDDILQLCRLRLPIHDTHAGLAGLVQLAGLIAFALVAATGVLLFAVIEPGVRATGLIRLVKEVHEAAETVIPVCLALHVGAVVLHAFFGHHLWRHMFFLDRKCNPESVSHE